MRPEIDADRLWADIMALAAITDPDQPWTRRSFTPRFREGRAWLAARFIDAGLDVRLDAAGNLSGRRGPAGARTVLIGSHTDTVPGGGRFDGIAGVAAALEVARALAGRPLNHALEVVDYLAEEPSVFGLSCVGSRAMAGKLDDAMLAFTGPDGGTLAQAIRGVGGDPEHIAAARRSDIALALELHIEQGRVLESAGVTLGIVSAIVGIARVEIRFEGAADHAGTTPMDLRRDAMVPAAETIAAVSALAQEYAMAGHGHFVATTGVVEVTPNAANVVPGMVRMIVEVRAETAARIEDFLIRLAALSRDAAARHRVTRPVFRTLSRTDPVACDADLRALLRDAALLRGTSTMDMASGAGHDTAFIAAIAPAAMVFVPSKDGRSHAPEEWSDRADIAAGAEAMLGAILAFDARPIHRK
ncbi:MAG: Zn-dependent hydrolase [Bauldia sp.]|nr:Zn-dependent hydrolase [Bauldia sp.]